MFRQRFERLLDSMNLVTREEFDAVKAMAEMARLENEALSKEIESLKQGKAAAKPKSKAAKSATTKSKATTSKAAASKSAKSTAAKSKTAKSKTAASKTAAKSKTPAAKTKAAKTG
jgi:BMFP domain-containing protein YqiC